MNRYLEAKSLEEALTMEVKLYQRKYDKMQNIS